MPLRMTHEGDLRNAMDDVFSSKPNDQKCGFCLSGWTGNSWFHHRAGRMTQHCVRSAAKERQVCRELYRKLNQTCWIRVLRISRETGVRSTGFYSMTCDQTVGGQMDC
ncbi:hypothetical protein H4Q32_012054 [Labeo rohita]|uniref:Uncharacterized protein n=1 Tax=Labeo rohita TaxID=84645 RepID=A0ABQ8MLQ1_LABRO|nr:hypothetical protein H4Q32_012054 [Labeo rohita]